MGILRLTDTEEAETFKGALVDAGIEFKEKKIEVLQVEVNIEEIVDINVEEETCSMQTTNTLFPVISDKSVERIDLSPGETSFHGYSDIMETFISFKGFWWD